MTHPSDPGAPIRHPIDWQNPDFYNEENLDEEMRRVLDICHGCRRCFNLCDSFPKLFDLVDESPTGELDSVSSADFKPVVDACTLCDMCFVNKCPYVPPHEFNLDFPHLMLRHRAVEVAKKNVSFVQKNIAQMDRNAKIAAPIAPLVNWATDEKNTLTRPMMEKIAGIDARAFVPKFQKRTFMAEQKNAPHTEPSPDQAKVALYVTCYGNYHETDIARAALNILQHLGVHVEVVYPGCCGMPVLEQGRLKDTAKNAEHIAQYMKTYIEDGYTVVPVVPSCTLMLAQEWPLLLPKNTDVCHLAKATQDIMDYIVGHIKKHSLDLSPAPSDQGDGVTLHLACHSRALNKGAKAAELLNALSSKPVDVIERCSGHGGSWGMMKENFETALKVGDLTFKKAQRFQNPVVASECPLAGQHIRQGMDRLEIAEKVRTEHLHPLILAARKMGLQG